MRTVCALLAGAGAGAGVGALFGTAAGIAACAFAAITVQFWAFGPAGGRRG